MSITINARPVRGITVIDLSGKVTIGKNNREFQTAIKQLVKEGKTELVLNLENVSVIDSSGLGEIIASYSTIKSNGGALVLVNMPARVKELMIITKLYTVFDVYDTEADAIAALEAKETPESGTPTEKLPTAAAVSGSSVL